MGNTKKAVSDVVRRKRQINYAIIRAVWNKCNRCKKFQNVKLYDIIGIPRNRYYRILANQYAGISKKDLSVLCKTGLDEKVFLGESALSIDEITYAEWSSYLAVQYQEEEDKEDKKRYNKVKQILSGLDGKYIKNHCLADNRIHILYSYFLTGIAVSNGVIENETLDEIINQLNQVIWDLLETASNEKRVAYEETLREQLELLTAVKLYKKYNKRRKEN